MGAMLTRLLILWSVMAGIAGSEVSAASVYVNGVQAYGLVDYEFERVNVRIDKNGNVWIDAPQYDVNVSERSTTRSPTGLNSYNSSGGQQKANIPTGRWWLVTEDAGSKNHSVSVIVNGYLVHQVRSGDAQVIKDLAPYLRDGSNSVVFNVGSSGSTGGPLSIYISTGSNRSGTVVLDQPQIIYVRTQDDRANGPSKTFQFTVP